MVQQVSPYPNSLLPPFTNLTHTYTGKEAYLVALIKAMISEDEDVLGNLTGMPKFTQDFIRVLPSLSLEYTNPKVKTIPYPYRNFHS